MPFHNMIGAGSCRSKNISAEEIQSEFILSARDGAVTVAVNGGHFAVSFFAQQELRGSPLDPGTDWRTYRLAVQDDRLRFLVDGRVVLERSGAPSGPAGERMTIATKRHQIQVRALRVMVLDTGISGTTLAEEETPSVATEVPTVGTASAGPTTKLSRAASSDVPMFRGNAAGIGEMPGPGPHSTQGVTVR